MKFSAGSSEIVMTFGAGLLRAARAAESPKQCAIELAAAGILSPILSEIAWTLWIESARRRGATLRASGFSETSMTCFEKLTIPML
jgi:hypothetical protein